MGLQRAGAVGPSPGRRIHVLGRLDGHVRTVSLRRTRRDKDICFGRRAGSRRIRTARTYSHHRQHNGLRLMESTPLRWWRGDRNLRGDHAPRRTYRRVPASTRTAVIRGLQAGTSYRFDVRTVNGVGVGPTTQSNAVTSTPGPVVAAAGRFIPVAPNRILDTRSGVGASGRLATQASLHLPVVNQLPSADPRNVPAQATAVVLNVTATDTQGGGYVQVIPTGRGQIGASSNLNVTGANQTIANLVIVPVGDAGRVTLFADIATHLIADVYGYFLPTDAATSAGRFVPIGPNRALDTRDGGNRLGAGTAIQLPLRGRAGLPGSGISAVVLNVTATDAAPGYVQVVPTEGLTPLGATSTLNIDRPGRTIAALTIVPLGAGGSVSLFSSSPTHLIADVVGYITDESVPPGSDGLFVPLSPARHLDTRNSRPVAPGSVLTVRFNGALDGRVPTVGVGAVFLNLTVTQSAAAGFLHAYPAQQVRPGSASNLNVSGPGQTIANASITALGSGGGISFFSESGTHLLADVGGYFTS